MEAFPLKPEARTPVLMYQENGRGEGLTQEDARGY